MKPIRNSLYSNCISKHVNTEHKLIQFSFHHTHYGRNNLKICCNLDWILMVRVELYRIVEVYIMLLWFMTPCGLVEVQRFFKVIYHHQTWTEAIYLISSKSWYFNTTFQYAVSNKKAKLWCLKGTFSINLLLHCYMKMPGKRLHILTTSSIVRP